MRRTGLMMTAASVMLMGTTASYADVTVEEVVNTIAEGQQLDGDGVLREGELSIANISIKMKDVLIKQDGPNVIIEPNGVMTVTSKTGPEVDGPAEKKYLVSSPDMVITLNELDGAKVRGTMTAPQSDITVEQAGKIISKGLSSDFDVDLSHGGVSTIKFSQKESEGKLSVDGVETETKLAPLNIAASFTHPDKDVFSYETPFLAIKEGMRISVNAEGEGAVQTTSVDDELVTSSNGPWTVSALMDEKVMELLARTESGKFSIDGKEPFAYDVGAYDLRVKFPSLKGDDMASLSFSMADMNPDNITWDTVDPDKAMSRDPLNADIQIGLTLNEKARNSLFDGGEQTSVIGNPFSGFSIEKLDVSGMGVSVNGGGKVTFSEFGMPQDGAIKIVAKGLNGLLDTLAKSGVVPEGDLNSVRVPMMMMFKQEGDDTMSMEVTVDNGKISTNGMSLQ